MCRPSACEWVPCHVGPTGARHYEVLTVALKRAKAEISSYDSKDALPVVPAFVFDEARSEFQKYRSDVAAFSCLRELRLSIQGFGNEVTQRIVKNLSGLRMVLESLSQIEKLELGLPSTMLGDAHAYELGEVFGYQKKWPSIKQLVLDHASFKSSEFINLLHLRMPNIEYLDIDSIVLLSGTWEGVLAALSERICLSKFVMGHEHYQFWHRGGINFTDDFDSHFGLADFEEYVVKGGRHPCLKRGEDISSNQRFIDELDTEFEPVNPLTDEEEEETEEEWYSSDLEELDIPGMYFDESQTPENQWDDQQESEDESKLSQDH